MSNTQYMTAPQAYRAVADNIHRFHGYLSKLTSKQLNKLALELDVIGGYFRQHPNRWLGGHYHQGDKVCSVGLMQSAARKAAGITDFVRPATVNRMVGDSFIITMNDTVHVDRIETKNKYSFTTWQDREMGARNVASVYRVVAGVLRELAATDSKGRTSDDVKRLLDSRLEAAARKAEWGKLNRKKATTTKVSAKKKIAA